jgi:hypothetical protein
MLAFDRRIFDTPLEERLQVRTSDLVAWTTTMFPVIHHSISEARAQILTGHHETRSYFTDTTAAESTTNAMPNSPTAPTITTVNTNSRLLAIQQRLQHVRTQAATISRDIWQYFPVRRSAS